MMRRFASPRALAAVGRRTVVHNVEDEEHFEKLRKEHAKVVVDFYANWCGPCKMVAGDYEKLSNEFTDIAFLKVNVDNVAEVAEEANVSSIPHFQAVVNGKFGQKVIGANMSAVRQLAEDVKSL
eukprot:TRINITY_DN27963_c0_g1_i1.p4 TRINITY_DN27963_c0_g1~~TRINITY_DN27963_c0_g1_i1.p4  ORF type:complete len:124 (+),score=55.58 TRINITY_DN27963_c0_g1_i1:56-427(+)